MAQKGLYTFTVQEAQNATLGQAGTAFLTDSSTYTPPTGQVVIAIQFVEDTVFDSGTEGLIGENDDNFPSTVLGRHSFGILLPTLFIIFIANSCTLAGIL